MYSFVCNNFYNLGIMYSTRAEPRKTSLTCSLMFDTKILRIICKESKGISRAPSTASIASSSHRALCCRVCRLSSRGLISNGEIPNEQIEGCIRALMNLWKSFGTE